MTEPTAPLDLDAIRHRVPLGHEGPWYVEFDEETGRWSVGYPSDNPLAGLIATVPDYGHHLAEFIAHARQDVPALLAEVDRLRMVVDAAKTWRNARYTAQAGAYAAELVQAVDTYTAGDGRLQPRTWAIPEQPCDVHTVRGVRSGMHYRLDDNGDWYADDAEPGTWGECWEDVLLTEHEVVDASGGVSSGDGKAAD